MFPENLHKKALCVGISYKGQRGPYGVQPEHFELAGAHSDVWKVHDLLRDYYDYDWEKITVLLDVDGFMQPTRDNIVAAMEELVAGAQPGDNLFFFFAGHGDQITNIDGTEYDKKDEIILPLDWQLNEELPLEARNRYSRIIMDDDMNDILVKQSHGCRLTALFDSCHSGTIMDLPFSRFIGPRSMSPLERNVPLITTPRASSPGPESPQTQRPLRDIKVFYDNTGCGSPEPQSPLALQGPIDVDHLNKMVGSGPLELPYTLARVAPRGRMDPLWRRGTWIIRGDTLDKLAITDTEGIHAISWSACSDGQSGFEVKSSHENRSGGVMVEAFVEILKSQPYRTYRDILECLGNRIKRACYKINKGKPESQWIIQEPQLGSHQKPNLDEIFAP